MTDTVWGWVAVIAVVVCYAAVQITRALKGIHSGDCRCGPCQAAIDVANKGGPE